MSTLDDSCQYSYNTKYCEFGHKRDAGRLYESGYKKGMKKKKGTYLMFNFPLTKDGNNARPPDTAKLR